MPDNRFSGPTNDHSRRRSRRPHNPYGYPYETPPGACPAGTYIIEPGDSLYIIATRFGISIGTIVAANPNINFNYPLQVGQVICL
jgi:LysM repeat protein